MTYTEAKIEAISERTGDSRALVAEVVMLMKELLDVLGADRDFMDTQIPENKVAAVRKSNLKDKELIIWYKEGLRYYNLLKQKGSLQ